MEEDFTTCLVLGFHGLPERRHVTYHVISYMDVTYRPLQAEYLLNRQHPTEYLQNTFVCFCRQVFLHDVATAFVEPTLAALLRQVPRQQPINRRKGRRSVKGGKKKPSHSKAGGVGCYVSWAR